MLVRLQINFLTKASYLTALSNNLLTFMLFVSFIHDSYDFAKNSKLYRYISWNMWYLNLTFLPAHPHPSFNPFVSNIESRILHIFHQYIHLSVKWKNNLLSVNNFTIFCLRKLHTYTTKLNKTSNSVSHSNLVNKIFLTF